MSQLFTIKPLEWERHATKEWHTSSTVAGLYEVRFIYERWNWSEPNGEYVECESIDDGKAKAEAHYRERLAAALDPVAWQPMNTAPKNKEILLLVEHRAGIPGKQLVGHYMRGGHCIEDHPAIDEGWYFWNGAMFDVASKPLYWLPLPDGPKT